MITGIACFVGGIFFAAYFPLPSSVIRSYTVAGIDKVKSLFTKTPPPPPPAKD